MFGNGRNIIVKCIQNEFLGTSGVGHGFLCRERFGGYQKECCFGIDLFENFRQMSTIDIAAKVHVQITFGVRFQGFAYHDRTQITPTNPNVDNGLNGFPGMTLPFSIPNLVTKDTDPIQNVFDIGHDILSIDKDGCVGKMISQCHVQYSTTFGGIDFFTGKHGLSFTGDTLLFRQLIQQLHGFICYNVFGIIQQQLFTLVVRFLKGQ